MTAVEPEARGTWATELDVAIATVRAAGAEIARFVAAGGAAIRAKGDNSPVTDADIASDRIIRARVGSAFPGDALLTEEGADDEARLTVSRCWIADPLDGTQEFINGTGQFDVFLALAVDGVPVVAATCHPVSGRILAAAAGAGAWAVDGEAWQPLRIPPFVGDTPRLNTNRYHTRPAAWPLLLRVAERAGFVPPVAPGPFYPRAFFALDRAGPAYEAHLGIGLVSDKDEHAYVGGEWDLAAPDLILAEAGGLLTDLQGRRLRYNQRNPMIRHGLIAASSPALSARLVAAYAGAIADRHGVR